MVQKFGSRNMTVLYPIPCYNEACYKGTETVITFKENIQERELTFYKYNRNSSKTISLA